MSRTPIEGFSQSNGHGRAQAGKMAVSRQSNLIVETTNPVSTQSLRKSLIEECIRQKKPYGLLFSQIKGGYTITSRTSPNTFNITPLVVYRVYTDGRPDELVRGVDIVGTPLTAIAKIIASGNDVAVFNGYCGAESGSVAVGAVSPSLLVKELEVQRKSISQATPPVLAAPKDSFGPYADGLKKGSKKDKTEQIIEVMETEIARTINHLRLPDSPLPYFASCAIIKSKKVYAGAELGSTIYSKNSQYAKLNVSLRVGDHKLDNTNFMPPYPSDGNSILDVTMPVPIDMDPFVIRRAIWLSMDQAYKTAIENFKRKKSVLQTLASLPDENDFSGAQVYTHFPKIKPVRLPEAKELEKKAKDISMVMRDAPGLRRSYTGVGTDRYETWYANSEGSKNHNVTTSAYVASLALAQSEDGTMVGDNISFFADDIDTLKPLPGIKKAVKKLCLRVSSMSTAPKIDDYIGPVLFEGQAAAELCSRVLSPAFSNYRKPVAEWVQWKKRSGSLRRKIGSRIMSTAFNVFDDPTINILKGGHYLKSTDVDLEGVKPEKVQLVKNGILKTLLTTRNPDKRLPKSNGHAFHVSKGSSGTPQYYASPTNLFIEYKKGVKRKKLKKRLLKAIKDQGIEYGLIIRRISPEGLLLVEGSSYYNYGGGESGDINDPMFAFRVFPDGREELVRVGLLNRIQISTFKDVLTAGKKQYVLSSREGERLISVIAPSILFEEGILQKYEGDIYKSSIIESPILSINK
jgi:predicted Zn-dependent protease